MLKLPTATGCILHPDLFGPEVAPLFLLGWWTMSWQVSVIRRCLTKRSHQRVHSLMLSRRGIGGGNHGSVPSDGNEREGERDIFGRGCLSENKEASPVHPLLGNVFSGALELGNTGCHTVGVKPTKTHRNFRDFSVSAAQTRVIRFRTEYSRCWIPMPSGMDYDTTQTRGRFGVNSRNSCPDRE